MASGLERGLPHLFTTHAGSWGGEGLAQRPHLGQEQGLLPPCPGWAARSWPSLALRGLSQSPELTPGHSGPRPRTEQAAGGLPQAGSLGGDESRDLPPYSRVTAQKQPGADIPCRRQISTLHRAEAPRSSPPPPALTPASPVSVQPTRHRRPAGPEAARARRQAALLSKPRAAGRAPRTRRLQTPSKA